MTLQKVKTGQSFPFLRPYEAEIAKSAKIVQEPRTMDTKQGDNQNVLDLELSKSLTSKDYEKQDLESEEITKRTETNKRTWFPNGTSWNFMIDQFGENESDWVNKTIEFEVHKVMVDGKRKKATYIKGSVKEEE